MPTQEGIAMLPPYGSALAQGLSSCSDAMGCRKLMLGTFIAGCIDDLIALALELGNHVVGHSLQRIGGLNVPEHLGSRGRPNGNVRARNACDPDPFEDASGDSICESIVDHCLRVLRKDHRLNVFWSWH